MNRFLLVFFAVATPALAGKIDVERAKRHHAALLEAATANSKSGAAKGDALFDLYVQTVLTGAKNAGAEPEAEVRAGLAALGVFMDDRALKNPLVAKAFAGIETPEAERQVERVRGTPTCGGRADAALHFTVSAALTVALGEGIARMGGVQKELEDMHALDNGAGSGFSFADLASNEAGLRFAKWLLESPAERLKTAFSQKSCFPSLQDLPEGLRTDEFDDKYGPVGSGRYEKQMKLIAGRLDALDLYKEEEEAK